jgi:hypothetical protein
MATTWEPDSICNDIAITVYNATHTASATYSFSRIPEGEGGGWLLTGGARQDFSGGGSHGDTFGELYDFAMRYQGLIDDAETSLVTEITTLMSE